MLALNSQQVIGLRLTADPSWFSPETLQQVASHVGKRTSEGVTSPYGHHVLQLGARTLTIDQSFLKASAATLEHPLERMFDDIGRYVAAQAAKASQQQTRQPSLAAVLGPLRSLHRDFIEAPVLTFYTVPWRPLAVLGGGGGVRGGARAGGPTSARCCAAMPMRPGGRQLVCTNRPLPRLTR